jgi:hypothetical protein
MIGKKTFGRLVTTTFALVISMSLAAAAEVWITPSATAGGVGTQSDPYRVTTGKSFYDLMSDLRAGVVIPTYTTIHLTAGTFVVSNGITLKTGWKIRGAGQDTTIVQLQTNHPAVSNFKPIILGGDYYYYAKDDTEVSDLTVDCNLQNQSQQMAPTAVGLSGNNSRVSKVKVINWGSTKADYEAFLIPLDNTGANGARTNFVVSDCVIGPAARVAHAEGTTGISIMGDGHIVGAELRNNFVAGITPGSGTGNPEFFHAFGITGNITGGRIVNNTALHLINSPVIYCDTGNIKNVEIANNTFVNVGYGIYYAMAGFTLNNVRIVNNNIEVGDNGCGIGYLATWPTSTADYMTNALIANNTIVPYGTNTTAINLSGRYVGIIRDNILQGSGNGWDFYVPYQAVPYLSLLDFRGNTSRSGTDLVVGNDAYWQPGMEGTIRFTPSSTGWYRILAAPTWNAGSVSVFSDIYTGQTDLEFSFKCNGFVSPPGTVQLLRQGSYSSIISKARVVKDSGFWCYLDIYVTTSGKELKITTRGDARQKFATPTLITTTPSPSDQTEVTF